MSNYKLLEISKEEFKNYQGSFLQSVEMSDLLAESGWEVSFLGVKSDQIELAALLASLPMMGGKHFEVQYGPVYRPENPEEAEHFFYEAIRDFVKARGALELLLIPNVDYQRFDDGGEPVSEANTGFLTELSSLGYHHLGLQKGYNMRGESAWHYVKDLSGLVDEKALLASYSKDGLYSVKKTQQFGIRVRPLAYDELALFAEISQQTAERKLYETHDLVYFQKFYKTFGSKAEFLVAEINFGEFTENLQKRISELRVQISKSQSAKKQKQRDEWQQQILAHQKRLEEVVPYLAKYGTANVALAIGLFVYEPSETVYLTSGSDAEFKTFYGPFALQHASMLRSIKLGIPSYNFFGIQGVFDGSDGVLHYKQSFAGYAVQKVGYFYYYPRPLKHKLISIFKRILGRS